MFRKILIAAAAVSMIATATQPALADKTFNGTAWNGVTLNGGQYNGFSLNGVTLNGGQYNGIGPNGTAPIAPSGATLLSIELPQAAQ